MKNRFKIFKKIQYSINTTLVIISNLSNNCGYCYLIQLKFIMNCMLRDYITRKDFEMSSKNFKYLNEKFAYMLVLCIFYCIIFEKFNSTQNVKINNNLIYFKKELDFIFSCIEIKIKLKNVEAYLRKKFVF